MISLPKGPLPPSEINPRLLLLYGLSFTGKSRFATQLPGDYLILDIDGNAGYFNCCRTGKITSYLSFIEHLQAIQAAKNPYKYLVVDSITNLIPLCVEHTTKIYNDNRGPKEPYVADIRDVPFRGNEILYTSFLRLTTMLEKSAQYIIFIGHCKDKWEGEMSKQLDVESKKGVIRNILEEPTEKVLDLPGKLANTFLTQMHAVGYFRKGSVKPDGTWENKIIFEGSADRYASRAAHLAGKTIDTDWNLIYI